MKGAYFTVIKHNRCIRSWTRVCVRVCVCVCVCVPFGMYSGRCYARVILSIIYNQFLLFLYIRGNSGPYCPSVYIGISPLVS